MIFPSLSSPNGSRHGLSLLLVVLCCAWTRILGQEACPTGIYHCNNPSLMETIWGDDPTVECDPRTCEWQLELLSPEAKPVNCANLEIVRASDTILDLLEPCLLWELIYGEFAPTAAPTTSHAPTISSQPSIAPTSSPSFSPTAGPTDAPTALPTLAPTSIPTRVPLTSRPTTMPTSGPSARNDEGNMPVETTAPNGEVLVMKNFNAILLTYIFPINTRRSLRALQTLTMRSRAELFVVTQEHLKATIANVQTIDLVLTPYQEYTMEGQVAVTEMLQGSMSLLIPSGEADDVNVDEIFGKAFSGNELFEYLERLRMTADEQLVRIMDISYGIPLGIPNLNMDPDGNNGSEETNNDKGNSLSGLWIGVLVCGTVGMIGLLAVGYVVLTRSSDKFRDAVGLKPANTGSITHGSPTSLEPQLIRRMHSVDDDSPRGEGQEMKLDDDELPEITREEDVVFNDMQSEITSVYSFVDRTCLNESVVTDDQSYSLAPSYLVRKSNAAAEEYSNQEENPALEQNSSNMWSVMDGLDHASPNQNNRKTAENSPSRLVISANRHQDDNDIYIFDDEVSLVSETSGMGSKITITETEGGFSARPPSPPRSAEEEMEPPNVTSVLRPKEKDSAVDLSQVMETSESSRNVSRASTGGRRSAPSSAAKNRSNKEESTDDDSSLFMGPESFSKENVPQNKKVVSLGEENKIPASDKKDSYLIAPLFQTTSLLSEKDKQHLGVVRVPSRDDSSLGESMILPGSYAVADFRDDMSISTAGSSRRHRGKASISTLASF